VSKETYNRGKRDAHAQEAKLPRLLCLDASMRGEGGDTRANLTDVAVAASVIKGPSAARTFSDSMYWIVPEDFQQTEDQHQSKT
jgi:hypothetical protein